MLTAARALRSDSLLVLSLLSRSSSSFAAEYSGRLLSLSRLQPPWMARAAFWRPSLLSLYDLRAAKNLLQQDWIF